MKSIKMIKSGVNGTGQEKPPFYALQQALGSLLLSTDGKMSLSLPIC